jgi:ankyrin repeat protein
MNKQLNRVAIITAIFLIATLEARAGEIHQAARKGDLAKVKELVVKDPKLIEAKDQSLQETPLGHAVRGENLAVVEYLISQGADVNAADKYQETPLHHAAVQGNKELCALLLAHGADVKLKNREGRTPLHEAATAKDSRPICESLLAKGAELNAIDKHGYTPLALAAIRGRYEVVKFLIASGADIKLGSADHATTPLHLAAKNNDLALAQQLISQGAGVKAPDYWNRTPLHFAAMKGSLELVKLLVEKGADVNAKEDNGFTPIDMASDRETIALLKSLGGKDDPQRRARCQKVLRQDEAKKELKDLSRAQSDYYDQNNHAYATTFQELGWTPDPASNYAFFLADDVIQPKAGGPYQMPAGSKATVSAKGFNIIAVGNIDDDPTLDVWAMENGIELKNLVNDVEQ